MGTRLNLNPGGPFGGSATQYFVGTFDGKKFVNESPAVTKWMDWGKMCIRDRLDAMHAYENFEKTGVYNSSVPALTTLNSNNEHEVSEFYIAVSYTHLNRRKASTTSSSLGIPLPPSVWQADLPRRVTCRGRRVM